MFTNLRNDEWSFAFALAGLSILAGAIFTIKALHDGPAMYLTYGLLLTFYLACILSVWRLERRMSANDDDRPLALYKG